MIRIYLIQLIIISVCQTSFAQSEIIGFVKSAITDLKLITDVYIEITNTNRFFLERMTMTDSLGLFRRGNFELNKTYILKLSAFGYANEMFEVKTDSIVTKTTLTLIANYFTNSSYP